MCSLLLAFRRSKHVEFMRKDTLSRVREIEKMLRGQEIVKEFDEDLFTALVEQIWVKSLVEVVFVLKAGVEVREILKNCM